MRSCWFYPSGARSSECTTWRKPISVGWGMTWKSYYRYSLQVGVPLLAVPRRSYLASAEVIIDWYYSENSITCCCRPRHVLVAGQYSLWNFESKCLPLTPWQSIRAYCRKLLYLRGPFPFVSHQIIALDGLIFTFHRSSSWSTVISRPREGFMSYRCYFYCLFNSFFASYAQRSQKGTEPIFATLSSSSLYFAKK